MNSTLKRLFLFIGFAIVLSTPINAQDYCYVRLGDASGLNTDTYQAGLETATREFIQQYPTLQDSFKVFDFGFYLHQESYQGSFPEVLQQKIDEVANLSPYYLLFGKQTDKTGVYTKFWVDLKLPGSGQF
ncbi:MAG: hypothetical protein R2828_28975 [Saprospiraceae bacterium]